MVDILFSLTQWYRTKLRAIVSNTNYFKPIIFKFKKFIFNSNSKIVYNFCIYGGNTPFVEGEVTPRGRNFLPLVFSERTLQNTQN